MPEYKTLRLDEIDIDIKLQPRDKGLNEDHVADLEEAYRNEETVQPPSVWFLPDETYKLSEGFHRMEAAKLAALKEMKFKVFVGTESECRIHAACSNQGHGLRRTNADKRAAIAVLTEECPQYSDRKIAEMAGVGHKLVAASRPKPVLGESPNTGPDKRIGKDGREYNASKPYRPSTTTPSTTSAVPTPPPEPVKQPEPAIDGKATGVQVTEETEGGAENGEPTVTCPNCLGAGRVAKSKVINLYSASGMPSVPPQLDTPEFLIVWEDWLQDRKKRKQPVTAKAAQLQLHKLAPLGVETAMKSINQSIESGWSGIFPEKQRETGKYSGRRGSDYNPSRVTGEPGDFDDCGPHIVVE